MSGGFYPEYESVSAAPKQTLRHAVPATVCLGENADRQMSSDMIKIKRGLDIPLAGAPSGQLDTEVTTRAVGLLGADYHGMKPTMAVKVGDVVKRGDLLFTDKKCEGVRYTSPAGGRVSAINRGAKRADLRIDVHRINTNKINIYFNKYVRLFVEFFVCF